MRDRPFRTPRAPKLDWPGGIVPEWAKAPAAAQRRGKGGKGARGARDNGKRERLQKVMAQSGHGSRRNIEILIAQGHITINGVAATLGDSVGPGDRVKVDGKLISLRFGTALPRVLLYHKPEGEICTRDDPEGRPTVFAKLPKVNNARWVSIGRLDFNTSGLLIFTTNGDLANRLMHPRYEIEREYAVRLMGELTPEQVQLLTGEGVDIDGEKCKFVRLVDRGGEGANHWYHVVLKEGKNREVRRMFEIVGLMVSRLMRVRYGPVELPSFLKRGMVRDMPEADVLKLMEFAGMNEAPAEARDEDEVEEEASPGNVITDENRVRVHEDFPEDDVDELQPAHLMEGYKPIEPEVFDEDDDDRQPDFESLPGFNRATGTMGLPAGHRGIHPLHAQGIGLGPGPGQGQGQGQKKRRGKRHGAKPGQGAGNGPFPPKGPFQSKGPGRGGQGQGQGKKRTHGKGQPHGGGRGQGQANATAQPGQGQPQPQPQGQGQQPPGQARGPAQGQGVPGGGQGKPGRNRRHRNRNRNRGAGGSPPPAEGGSQET
jgi:23S rRNA pseudouridine2605 synthase